MNDDLIERLEKTKEADRELDAEIFCVAHPASGEGQERVHFAKPHKADDCTPGTYWRIEFSGRSLHTAPRYTASIDVAVALVPAALGIMWDVAKYPGESAAAYVGPADVPVRAFVTAATPALALCIAALKARAA